MRPAFFKTPADFRSWLEQNHDKATELLVGFYKKGSGLPSITWPESVDQALCFGWIAPKIFSAKTERHGSSSMNNRLPTGAFPSTG